MTDRGTPARSTNGLVTITVVDTNDPPTAIALQDNRLPSRRSGFVVGSLAVTDQDKAAQYLFSTQDARFEFRNGQLALKPNTFLPTQANGTSIELLVQVVDAADPASQAVLPITLNVGSSVSPWQNFRDRLDVSRDRTITALDALQVINY